MNKGASLQAIVEHMKNEGRASIPVPISGKRISEIQSNHHAEPACSKHLPDAYHVIPTEGDFCPRTNKDPGRHNFSAYLSPTSKGATTFSKELNTFFIENQVNFAVEFDMDESNLPANLSIRVLVCYSDPTYVNQPIRPCSCNAHISNRRPEYGDRFIISTSRDAEYSEKGGHKMVTIKMSDMGRMGGKFMAVYSYASYTSCIRVGKNTRVSTVFSLMDNWKEVGRDVFYCSVCAYPPQVMTNAVKKSAEGLSYSQRRKRKNWSSPLSSTSECSGYQSGQPSTSECRGYQSGQLSTLAATLVAAALTSSFDPDDEDMDSQYPDEKGYYTFTWRLKDRDAFFQLCSLKRSCTEM